MRDASMMVACARALGIWASMGSAWATREAAYGLEDADVRQGLGCLRDMR